MNTQDQLPSRVTIEPFICIPDIGHFTDFSRKQHAWQLYITIGNIRNDSCYMPTHCISMLIRLMACPPRCAKKSEDAVQNVIGTVLSSLRNLDITGLSKKLHCANRFERQCYSLLATLVGDDLKHVIVSQVSDV